MQEQEKRAAEPSPERRRKWRRIIRETLEFVRSHGHEKAAHYPIKELLEIADILQRKELERFIASESLAHASRIAIAAGDQKVFTGAVERLSPPQE